MCTKSSCAHLQHLLLTDQLFASPRTIHLSTLWLPCSCRRWAPSSPWTSTTATSWSRWLPAKSRIRLSLGGRCSCVTSMTWRLSRCPSCKWMPGACVCLRVAVCVRVCVCVCVCVDANKFVCVDLVYLPVWCFHWVRQVLARHKVHEVGTWECMRLARVRLAS